MKVKDIVEISAFNNTIAITDDDGVTFHSFSEDDKNIMNAKVNLLEERNGIIILHIDKK